MPIRGLSNQWKTCEGLLEKFARDEGDGKWRKIRRLLELLGARPGCTFYIGTSHSEMNFSNRDVIRQDDRTQPFAYVDVVQSGAIADDFCYRVRTRRRDGIRPTMDWLLQDFTDPEAVVDLLVDTFAYADVPPRRGRNKDKG